MEGFPFGSDLETERLLLVPCKDEHLTGLSAINSDPDVMRYISGRPESLSETHSMIERVKSRWINWGYSWWSFIERQSGEIVGAGCIQNLRRGGAEPDADCPLEIGFDETNGHKASPLRQHEQWRILHSSGYVPTCSLLSATLRTVHPFL